MNWNKAKVDKFVSDSKLKERQRWIENRKLPFSIAATDKQKALMTKLNIKFNPYVSKAGARKLIKDVLG